MKFSVAMVRERLSEALDRAQGGEPVFIERRGVTYRLTVEPARKARPSRKPRLEVLDQSLAEGQWTWAWSKGALDYRPRKRR